MNFQCIDEHVAIVGRAAGGDDETLRAMVKDTRNGGAGITAEAIGFEP